MSKRTSHSIEQKEVSDVVKAREKAMKNYSLDEDRVHVLIAVTNHSQLDGDQKTGISLPEVAHPYYAFIQAGFSVHFISPTGGNAPLDPKSIEEYKSDSTCTSFIADDEAMDLLQRTLSPANVDPQSYVLLFFAGGHGALWDMPQSQDLAKVACTIYELGGVLGAVSHGQSGLLELKLESGEYLLKGKKITGFSNEEEAAVGLSSVVPFLLENKLKEKGAIYSAAEKFKPNVVKAPRLITGQNPASALPVAQAMITQIQDL